MEIVLLAILALFIYILAPDTAIAQANNATDIMRIVEANSGELIKQAEDINNVFDICDIRVEAEDPVGTKLCADFQEAYLENRKSFLQETQNLTDQILYRVQ